MASSSRARSAFDVVYQDVDDSGQRVDLIVEGNVLIELKAVPRLRKIHQQQALSYLKATDLRLGLLMNFNSRLLRDGLKRVVAVRSVFVLFVVFVSSCLRRFAVQRDDGLACLLDLLPHLLHLFQRGVLQRFASLLEHLLHPAEPLSKFLVRLPQR